MRGYNFVKSYYVPFSFETDRPITIKSLGFYGPEPGTWTGIAAYNVTVNLYENETHEDWRQNDLCATTSERIELEEGKDIFHVKLPSNKIKANTQYLISFILQVSYY